MKKKNIIQFSITMILSLAILFNMALPVGAAVENDLGKIVDGSELTNKQFSESIDRSVMRGNILNQGLAKITNNGDGTVNIYGAILGSVTCDKMTLKLTIQQYKNGGWYNYGTYSDVGYNTSSFSRSYNVSVASGYYYRVKGACVAQKGSTTESKAPVTDGIWIG
ncbi:DUF6147 family protein [Blautia marasmi]|uniref:DUF6147 family protein n=1 Tax=Blautia marasmi TaxID=1917868 RepID=UPI00266D2A41|nr:DUF6147 family protein [Blautia marasmi]